MPEGQGFYARNDNFTKHNTVPLSPLQKGSPNHTFIAKGTIPQLLSEEKWLSQAKKGVLLCPIVHHLVEILKGIAHPSVLSHLHLLTVI